MTGKEKKLVRVRFAPSPTGRLHIGTARTALFNWLFARNMGGVFILRIEDTDAQRSTGEFEKDILEDLSWLGLNWDEGPDVGGDYGPYRQTERLAAGFYARALERLPLGTDDGRGERAENGAGEIGYIYDCFCSPEELAAERERALAAGEMPKYSGKCRDLDEKARAELSAAGRRPVKRFAVPAGRTVRFADLLKGEMEFSTSVIGDFIVERETGLPTYNFVAAVDDADMEISHVIRGEDHLTNTVRQLLILEALGETPPRYAHLSMILGPDRTKLSKRHGATSVGEYREAGYLPEGLVNNLAMLSWSSASGEEIMDIDTIRREFSLARVSKSPPVFDGEKLKWFNARHIRDLAPERLAGLARPFLPAAWTEALDTDTDAGRSARIAEAVRTNITVLSDFETYARIFFEPAKRVAPEEAPAGAAEITAAAADVLSGYETLTIEESKSVVGIVKDTLRERGHKPKEIFQSLRLALTGELSGPELFYLFYAFGPKESARRLANKD